MGSWNDEKGNNADTVVVILNKDNAEGLKRTLESLTKQTCKLCKCFDIYIVDGSSTDDSKRVYESFSNKYRCIYWITQTVTGGTGPARIEILNILRRRGYRYVVWGDSENEYSEIYIEELVSKAIEGCDVVSGKAIVKNDSSIYGDMFYWYHSIHNMLPNIIGSKHAPGNNSLFSIRVYEDYMYPPITRSEDYFLTINILLNSNRGRKTVRYCINEKAKLYIYMVNRFKDILSWQKHRVRGIIEGSIYYNIKIITLPDMLFWIILSIIIITAPILSLLLATPIPLYILVAIFIPILLFLAKKFKDHVAAPHIYTPLLGLLGVVLHGVLSMMYLGMWYIMFRYRYGSLNNLRKELLNKFMKLYNV